jgi:hypothetical protein
VKLKLDKKFQPCEVDEDDEVFPNGIFVFNVTKLIAHIGTNPGDFPVEKDSLILSPVSSFESIPLGVSKRPLAAYG